MIIAIPEVLREKLGAEGARALADLLNEASVRTRGDVIEIAASRFEQRLAEELAELRAELRAEFRSDLSAEIGQLRSELHSEIGALRAELHSEIGALRAEFHTELHSEIGGLRAEVRALEARVGAFEGRITRWMFVFWVGQLGAILGVFFALFRA